MTTNKINQQPNPRRPTNKTPGTTLNHYERVTQPETVGFH
jgi:hypothetical protein